ncbi:MAG: hypothetical protein V7739_20180 [Motiliproteus sp.]
MVWKKSILLILGGLLFNGAHAALSEVDIEALLIKSYGERFKKDLSVSDEIETTYFDCKRVPSKGGSIRKAKTEGTYEWTVKMGGVIKLHPEKYGYDTYFSYDYTTVGGIDIYGLNYTSRYAFMENDRLITYLYNSSNNNKSVNRFDCNRIESFFGKAKAKLLFLDD